jgi:predicted nuclease of predicted toxin-antitoxin system
VARFLVDEDLPRSLAPLLRAAGLDASDVRDLGLRGRSDDVIFTHATENGLALLSGDLGFGNVARFPLGRHRGIVIVRFPNDASVSTVNEAIVRTLRELSDEEIDGSIVVIEPGRIRLRRRR